MTGISLNTATGESRLLVDAASAAEAAGFSSIWCYDHLSGSAFGGEGSAEVWTVLGAIAGATTSVTIGPLVVNVITRPAAYLAVAAASLQDLSGGRMHLGLGAGASSPSRFAAELQMFDLPDLSAADRRAQVAETIAFLRALWAGNASFAGSSARFHDVVGVSRPMPVPPIIVGANGPKMAALAGRHADGVNLHSWERDLAGLIGVARDAAPVPEALAVSVEGPWEPEWLDPASPTRRHLADDLAVGEVMVMWRVEHGLAAIEQAGRWQ